MCVAWVFSVGWVFGGVLFCFGFLFVCFGGRRGLFLVVGELFRFGLVLFRYHSI